MASKSVWKLFSSKYLVYTDTTICASLFALADVFEQQLYHGQVDWWRTLRVGTMGVVLGPMNHYYYKVLERVVPGAPSFNVVAKKIASDIIVSPIFASTFISGVAFLEGKSVRDSLEEYRRKFFRVLMLDLCVWPPTQAINFALLHPRFRVAYVSTIQFGYGTALTYIKHSEAE